MRNQYNIKMCEQQKPFCKSLASTDFQSIYLFSCRLLSSGQETLKALYLAAMVICKWGMFRDNALDFTTC